MNKEDSRLSAQASVKKKRIPRWVKITAAGVAALIIFVYVIPFLYP